MSAKKFSNKVMEYQLPVKVSRGMFKKLTDRKKQTGESISHYVRMLIMNDLNIDHNGKEINTR